MKVFDASQMKSVDQQVICKMNMSSLVLMEQVAMNLYHEIIQYLQSNQSICVVCGNGNNGGDGFALARLLHLNHYQVCTYFVGDESQMSHDCLKNRQLAQAFGVPKVEKLEKTDVIIDAILGIGCSRIVEGKYASIIQQINEKLAFVMSIDVPSGVNSDTAQIMGCCVKANITMTIGALKQGCLIHPGLEQCGQLKVIEVSSLQYVIDSLDTKYHLIDHTTMKKWLPKRVSHSHKGTYGKVLCVGGSSTMSGSITMASLAAYRSGCGIVTAAIPSCIQSTVASSLLEALTYPLKDENGFLSKASCEQLKKMMNDYSCIVYGCGVGRNEDQVEILRTLIQSQKPLIIDADGLVALKLLLSELDERRTLILTPHLAEFARLFDYELEDVIEHRYACLEAVQKRYPQLIIVLKSETTMIQTRQQCWINHYGNNGLAVGGSGDTLVGIIGGLLAQSKDEFKSCVLGVYLHACCADELVRKTSEYSLMPTDLLDYLPEKLRILNM